MMVCKECGGNNICWKCCACQDCQTSDCEIVKDKEDTNADKGAPDIIYGSEEERREIMEEKQ